MQTEGLLEWSDKSTFGSNNGMSLWWDYLFVSSLSVYSFLVDSIWETCLVGIILSLVLLVGQKFYIAPLKIPRSSIKSQHEKMSPFTLTLLFLYCN